MSPSRRSALALTIWSSVACQASRADLQSPTVRIDEQAEVSVLGYQYDDHQVDIPEPWAPHILPLERTEADLAALARPTDTRTKRLVAALERYHDPAHWAVHADQSPIQGYENINYFADAPDIGTFDTLHFHPFSYDRWGDDYRSRLNTSVRGCGRQVIARDGTLCPSVVLPAKPLPIGVGRALLDTVASAPTMERNAELRGECIDQSKLAFVYRHRGVPVGVVTLSVKCREIAAFPGPRKRLEDAASQRVFALCATFGVDFCQPANDAPVVRAAKHYAALHPWQRTELRREKTYVTSRVPPRPLPVDGSRTLSSLNDVEKRRLCVWNTEHVVHSLAPRRGYATADLATDKEYAWTRSLTFADCEARFPRQCDQSITRVLPCVDRVQRGEAAVFAPGDACEPLVPCLWGFEGGVDVEEW